MKHHNHWRYERVAARLSKRAEASLDFILAMAIGCGLAWVLVKWWFA